MTNSIAEIENTDLIFITGSNTTECHPIIGRMVKHAVERKRAKLIVVDPRNIELVKYAHVWLTPRPGTDVAWINGMIHVIIEEDLWDRDYVRERTEEFESLKSAVAEYTPEYVERICGIASDQLRRAARMYAKAPKAMILYAMGITQHSTGTDNVKSLANLAMLCGNVGIEGGGVNPLRGQNNVQGACDMGALPDVMPGYQPVIDEHVLAEFEQNWNTGIRLSNRPGLALTEMFPAALQRKLRAMLIMGENPVLSDANASHVKKALESLDFLVVQDIFMTETAQLADVVFPAASFAEKDGTFTNTERRVQRVRKAIDPPGNARTDADIICALARAVKKRTQPLRMKETGDACWCYESSSAIFDELASMIPSYAGISYSRLEKGGLQWPCPDKYHLGTAYLHKDKFVRGLGKFHAVKFIPPAELPDDEFPLYLSTGRIRFHYHTGTMTRRSSGLEYIASEAFVEMNPDDAQSLRISDGDLVRVISRRGNVKAKVRISDSPLKGTVFSTFHYKESPFNLLTNDALDPVGKIPEYKVCAVRIEKTA